MHVVLGIEVSIDILISVGAFMMLLATCCRTYQTGRSKLL